MALINIAGKSYELVLENKSGWNAEAFRNRYSEVLERYDYIVGDWGYEQLRLKGFFKDGSSKATKESVFSFVVDYINEYCNFGCAYFVLEKKGEYTEQSSTEEIDPLLADLDQIFDDEAQQASIHTSQTDKHHDDSSDSEEQVEIKHAKQQGHSQRNQADKQAHPKGQEKKRRPFKQRSNKNGNSNNHNNSQQTASPDEGVKEPSKKNKRRPRPYRHFDRKKNKEQVSSTQE